MPLDIGFDPIGRSHLDLRAENGGAIPWCGPAALALATGDSYAAACRLLHAVSPTNYPAPGVIVTAWWRDLVEAVRRRGMAGAALDVGTRPGRRWPRLQGFAKGLPAGWYLVRVTDHFLLLQLRHPGLAVVHDNRHTAVPLSPRVFGLHRVTHALRLQLGHGLPLPAHLPQPVASRSFA